MTRSSPAILYIAYGTQAVRDQALFSLLTLHHHLRGNYGDLQVVIYTDDRRYYDRYASAIPIAFEPVTRKQIQALRGELDFVHRAKVCLIRDFLHKYHRDMFFLDSDTYFTRSPAELLEQISPQTSIMNSDDYDLNDTYPPHESLNWFKIRRAIRDHTYTVNGQEVKIPLTTRMWNSGVIGLSRHNAGLLDDILSLTDQIYRNVRVFTAEQFAFSYFLQNRTRVIDSGDAIFHYWPNFADRYWKDWYSYHFSIFFRKYRKASVDEQAALAHELTKQHDELMHPPRKPLVLKIATRLRMIARVAVRGKL